MIKKKILEKRIEKREENNFCRYDGNPTDKQYKKPNLEQRELSTTKPIKISMMRKSEYGSERFLTGLETRGQPPNHDSDFAQALNSGCSFILTSPIFLLELNVASQNKALSLSFLTACLSKQITS